MIWTSCRDVDRRPLQTLSGRIDIALAPLEHVNSAGVTAMSPAENGSLGDEIFHLSAKLVLLTVQTLRNLPSTPPFDVAR